MAMYYSRGCSSSLKHLWRLSLALLLLLSSSSPSSSGIGSISSFVHAVSNDNNNNNDNDVPVFLHKSVIIPHDSKKHRGGEDAAATSFQYLIVADGVGGWARHNINPGLYSRHLTKTILELASMNATMPLQELVHTANWITAEQHLGSATCTVVKLVIDEKNDNGENDDEEKIKLHTLNIGDSGYSIHRYENNNNKNDDEWKVIFASEPGQKRFNFPHQLGGKYGDQVEDVAVEKTHILKPNDVIVVYSDGVSDNVYPHEFHDCIQKGSSTTTATSAATTPTILSFSWIADCIAKQAYELGKNKQFLSPFAKGARESKLFHPNYIGGKHDDITVIVAQVVSSAKTATQRLQQDLYFQESIYLYTGEVTSKNAMPKLQTKYSQKQEKEEENIMVEQEL